ncbi:hypothetical protein [Sinorhizobium meliloti]|uniref:hypothetical protein n=1 Tax=Rhizobium meliloti TaxID=382 RepID=UPI00208FFCFC|nr:hypothetical protein [Sinorhizobium meliloti]MCO5965040.1 hypothetical protein [Sinorhizobium meliloti]
MFICTPIGAAAFLLAHQYNHSSCASTARPPRKRARNHPAFRACLIVSMLRGFMQWAPATARKVASLENGIILEHSSQHGA